LVDNGKAFLFDTPWDNKQTETLATWLADSLNLIITDFVPNHWHGDCMGGLEYLHSINVQSYANQITIDSARNNKLPVPQNGFTDFLRMKLGDIDVYCYYLGGGHATDNIVVWIPSEKILFPGCMVKDIQATNLGNLSDASPLEEWMKTIDRLLEKFPMTEIIIVPGHGESGGEELLIHTKKLLSESLGL
jgi:metallo-beta-lactamase class B